MRGPADVAARIFSVLPFRPSPFHTGPGAGSGVGTAAPILGGLLSVACFGPAVLVRSTERDAAPCADGAGDGVVHTAGPVCAHRARSAHPVGLLSLRASGLALPAASRCAHLLGSAGDPRTALPASVPVSGARRLRSRGRHVREYPHNLHQRRGSPARLADALPCRAPLLPVRAGSRPGEAQCIDWRAHAGEGAGLFRRASPAAATSSLSNKALRGRRRPPCARSRSSGGGRGQFESEPHGAAFGSLLAEAVLARQTRSEEHTSELQS